MTITVHLDDFIVGTLHRYAHGGGERTSFRYADEWLHSPRRFSIDPDLHLDARTQAPARGALHGALADSGPDRWGKQLMQRRERRDAEAERRKVRTLSPLDTVLAVSDISRLGALRFAIDGEFVAPGQSVPPLVRLGDLLDATRRLEEDRELPDDLALIFAPGSSLGGARPKASVLDGEGHLSIAKFPRSGDAYSVERWEYVALLVAAQAGVSVADARLIESAGAPVLLSRRFDRRGSERVHFVSAMTLLGLRDGDAASYPDLADFIQTDGATPTADNEELFRRMVLSICIANVDDHLRNHGFLRDPHGWKLSPAYDLNPVPAEIRPRILSTSILTDDATGTLALARESAPYFGLTSTRSELIIDQVQNAVRGWKQVARKAGAPASEIQIMRSAFAVDP